MTIVLWNIRSAWNVGSIIRSCDAVGADVILVGYTPRPEGLTLKAVVKTAIGAEKNVKWQAFEHYQEVLQALPNYQHWGIEINQESQDILEFLDESKTRTFKGDNHSEKTKNNQNNKENGSEANHECNHENNHENKPSWENTCLWFGNEITGLPVEVGQNLTGQLHLPMKGQKESLNVSNTVTAAAYLWMWGTK